MSKILFNEINPGFTTLIVSFASYLGKTLAVEESILQGDVSSQKVNVNLQESYNGTGSILKDRKRKADKKTKSLYAKWPKIEPEIKKSRRALENYVYVS